MTGPENASGEGQGGVMASDVPQGGRGESEGLERHPGRPIVFLDTETTGIATADQPWEFAAIRREPDGIESTQHFQIDHDVHLAERLPEKFRVDHDARYRPAEALSRREAAGVVAAALAGVTIVGACPWFDTGMLAALMRAHGLEPSWHHRLRCVESMAVGFFGYEVGGLSDVAKALGVETPAAHTAMGDVLTTKVVFDLMTNGRGGAA